MTPGDKELLLKDICVRLPYGVKCKVIKRSIDGEMLFIRNELELTVDNVKELVTNNMYEIKPYLFPLSSMTEEQKKELRTFDSLDAESTMSLGEWAIQLVDFYNKYHLDYRGLIPKGLANDATGLSIY